YDNFRNIEEIGKGGFSVVYKTSYRKQYGTYEEVAIKIINDSHKDNQLFLNEIDQSLRKSFINVKTEDLNISRYFHSIKLPYGTTFLFTTYCHTPK
ncbi:7907_t:CDS:2, partial [Cetraspora pellucida]